MNALVEPVFGNIPLNLVRESQTNPRKTFNPETLAELAESIKRIGVGQAILVRPMTNIEGCENCVEIVAGARRYRASMLAGLDSIPAIVRDMSDIEVEEFQLVENIQRDDVEAFEEADGIQRLMGKHGKSAEAVAKMISQSRSYVFGRLKLLAMPQSIRTICSEGNINASIALLIARIPVEELQKQAAEEVINNDGDDEPMSYRRARDHIRTHYMLDFNRATFAIADASLVPSAGSCGDCPKRTGNQPEIYGDITSADVCTDSHCWFSKTTAHGERILKDAEDKGLPIKEVRNMYEASFDGALPAQTNTWRFERVNKNGIVADLLTDDELPDPVAYAKTPDGQIRAFYNTDAMQLALEKAGICISEAEAEAEEKAEMTPAEKKADEERQALEKVKETAADLETNVRIEVYRRARAASITEHGLTASAMKEILKSMLLSYNFPKLPGEELPLVYGFNVDDDALVSDHIEQATPGELGGMIMDLFVAGALNVHKHQLNESLQIDLEELEDDDDCLWLALANQNGIGIDEVRQELLPPVQDDAPIKSKRKSKKAAAAADAESVEPKVDDDAVQVMDVVLVNDDAKDGKGKKRKVAGKTGVVVAIDEGIYSVKFSHKQLVTDLTLDELTKTNDALPAWWSDAAAAWPFPTKNETAGEAA